ncbi:hypothetical protein [Desulfosporosinus sp.]|uniref:hypothetical protein n=1 Tax=Desulfosporosinus sp. TaxID=157907 RepID=UPI00262AD00E|nr:hypothetical protein [Desulfosporosinus sp.]
MGLDKKVKNILSTAGLPVTIYSGIASEPNSDNIALKANLQRYFGCYMQKGLVETLVFAQAPFA